MHDMPEKIDSKFRYVLLAATRAEQLMRGAQSKLDKPAKHTTAAMREVTEDLLDWDYGPRPEPVVEPGEDDDGEGIADEAEA